MTETRRHEDTKGHEEFLLDLEDDSFQAILDEGDVEVDEDSQALVGQFEIGFDLGQVNGVHGFDCFAFDDEFFLNQEVQAEARLDGFSQIADRNEELPLHFEAAGFKFEAKTLFVDGFEEPRPERGVDAKEGVDHL
jgi:hypothetical protein